MTWRLMKGKRETPCCRQQVRVKVVEPGYQDRYCPLCKTTSTFVLEEIGSLPGTLRLRWLTGGEVARMHEWEPETIIDIADL